MMEASPALVLTIYGRRVPQAADLHGQDPPLPVGGPEQEGGSHWVHDPDQVERRKKRSLRGQDRKAMKD